MLENCRRIVRNRLRVSFLPDLQTKLAADYRAVRGREPDFSNPGDFSEWLMGEMSRRRFDRHAPLADKLAVRDFVTARGLGDLLPKLYGTWKRPSQIDYDALPEQFVLKTNHGCGWNIVCRDKGAFECTDAARKLNLWRRLRYNPFETHYSLIPPRIFAEEFLDGGGGVLPLDYKFMCFRGEVFAILICAQRESGLRLYLFDGEWNPLPQYLTDPPSDHNAVPEPPHLESMKEYARRLSSGFDFVRVDLYDLAGRVVFGELTFTPAAGRLAYFTDGALREMMRALE